MTIKMSISIILRSIFRIYSPSLRMGYTIALASIVFLNTVSKSAARLIA